MELENLSPPRGNDTYRIGDSDDLVVVENIVTLPPNGMCLQKHGIIFICTEGKAQFEYDGTVVKLQKNDLFLYINHCTLCNFLASSDFRCRQIWLTRSEMGDIDIYTPTSVADISLLKLFPIVHLADDEVNLLDTYFQLLCNRMTSSTSALGPDIVRSLFGTMLLEILAIMRHDSEQKIEQAPQNEPSSNLHKRRIIDHFMLLVEKSDGRIRKVDEFANQLNITPKYLSSILKDVMNIRPSICIQHYTMRAIHRRLRFTDMTMQEIANDLNFPNASFFGKYFKEHSGMTPLEYRMKYHKER